MADLDCVALHGDARRCTVPGCGAAFTADDPEALAMRMRHHLGNHYATSPEQFPELAPFAPPYVAQGAESDG